MLVKNENCDLLADFNNILNRWKKYFSQSLNVHRVSDATQIEILHKAETLVSDPSPFEVEIAIAKMKKYKSPSSDQIPAERIQTGGETLRSEIHKLIHSIWNKKELPDVLIRQILEKKSENDDTVHKLFIDFKKAYASVRREILYNILIEFGVPMNLVRLIEMCLNETYSQVRIGKPLAGQFPIQNGLKQGCFIVMAFQLRTEIFNRCAAAHWCDPKDALV
jgi:hypothetical protein